MSDNNKNKPVVVTSNSPAVVKKSTAAVTISDDERRRLAAFRELLSGGAAGATEGDNNNSSTGKATFGGGASLSAPSTTSQQQASSSSVASASASLGNDKQSLAKEESDDDDEEERRRMAKNARAAWQQSTPERGSGDNDIWNEDQKQPGSQTAVFSRFSSAAAGAPTVGSPSVSGKDNGGAGLGVGGAGNNNVNNNNSNGGGAGAGESAAVHAPGVQRKAGGAGGAAVAMPEGRHLSVEAVPFQPKGTLQAAAAAQGGAAGVAGGGRRAPPSTSQHANSAAAQEAAAATAALRGDLAPQEKALDFMRWASSSFVRGPMPQDPVNSTVPLWMHLAVLPAQCGQPSVKRVMRAWAVQFGLESVEYWIWRSLVHRGVRVPIDCTEPDVLNSVPVFDFMKQTLKWYEKLSAYRDLKVVTIEDRKMAEKLAKRSHDEFVKYTAAYAGPAKAAYQLFCEVIRDLEAAPAPQQD